MANLNRVMLIGRVCRAPEIRTFANGGKVASFGFACNNRKKENGQWFDDPVFLDVKCFNRENGRKLADLVEETFAKGKQFYLEGHLVLEQWTDKASGQKRSKLVVVMDDFQYLEAKQGGGERQPRRESEGEYAPPEEAPYAEVQDIPF